MIALNFLGLLLVGQGALVAGTHDLIYRPRQHNLLRAGASR